MTAQLPSLRARRLGIKMTISVCEATSHIKPFVELVFLNFPCACQYPTLLFPCHDYHVRGHGIMSWSPLDRTHTKSPHYVSRNIALALICSDESKPFTAVYYDAFCFSLSREPRMDSPRTAVVGRHNVCT